MTSALQKINAFVQVSEGMRVYYDCPTMSSEDFQSDQFFRQNRGKIGLVKGFSEKFVGPLDLKGRLPGVYIKPGYIHVQFEGEETIHRGLNLHHFILFDIGQTVVPALNLEQQKVRELPNAIEFWPGDQVLTMTDLLYTIRFIENVIVGDDGTLTYVVAETTEAKQQRQDEKKRRREEARKSDDPMARLLPPGLIDFVRAEHCKAADLALVARGNIYHLYHDPSRLSFTSPEEEVGFWATGGVSKPVYSGSELTLRYEWPIEKAREIVEKGLGDLIIASKKYESVVMVGSGGDFKVRKLHSHFSQHSERVRALSLGLAEPPVEEDISFGKMALALLGDDD